MNDQIIVEEQNKKIGFIEYIKKKIKTNKIFTNVIWSCASGKIRKSVYSWSNKIKNIWKNF